MLVYVCKNLVAENERRDDPADVSIMAVHEWMMQEKQKKLGTDNEIGLKKIKEVKIDLACERPVRSVQRAFVEIEKVRKQYRLKVKEGEIIKDLKNRIEPFTV